MVNRQKFWIALSLVFYVFCPYILVVTAYAAVALELNLVYQLGSVLAILSMIEASLCVLSVLSPTIERFTIWHWRQLLFIK